MSAAKVWSRIGTILFLSGYCSLVYQVCWLRLLRLVFGVSTASQAAVVAIFMGGLGLGGYLFGRRLRRVRNPLAFYAVLELGIAVTAGVSPWLVELASRIYVGVGGASVLGLTAATLLRLALATVVLGVSTTLMGGTLPAVAQALERRADAARRTVAWLYGLNTLGAVAGAFVTTFYLVEWLGIHQSLWLTSLINLLLGMFVRNLARDPRFAADGAAPAEDAAPVAAPADATAPEPARLSRDAWVVLPVAGLVGFIFFLMELVWYRMLAPILGGSSYTFGLILTVALAGIGLGGLLYAVGPRTRRPTFLALAVTCALEGLCLALPYALGDYLAWFAGVVRPLNAAGFFGLVLSWTAVAGVVVFPAAVVAGYQFPLLIALLGRGERRVGYEVGLVYAWNTWGAIAGSLAGGFGLLPLLTAPRLWWLQAAVLAVLAAVTAGLDQARARRGWRLAGPLALAALTAGLCLADGPTAFWRHSAIGAGRARVTFDDPNQLQGWRNELRLNVVAEAEGVESCVALVARDDLALIVNGKSDGSSRGDAPTQVMGGLVGALLHPRPENALVIGLGTGTTAGWLAQVDTIARVDAVELEPSVIELAAGFAAVNQGVLQSPKVRMIEGDGREHVLTNPTRYDVIFSEPSNPYRAGVADLFSQDFYRAVARRLADDGVFLQWLQGYDADAQVVQTVFATIAAAFPHVETWQVHVSDLLLVASNEPIVHDFDRVRARVEQEPYRSALRYTWRTAGAEGFYTGFVADDALARAFFDSPRSRVSTDDRPAVEFGFARNVGRSLLFQIETLRDLARRLDATRPATARGAPLDWGEVDLARHLRACVGVGTYERAAGGRDSGLEHRMRARELYGQGQVAPAGEEWQKQGEEPRRQLDLLLVAEALAERGDGAAEPYLAALAPAAPTEVSALRARLAWRQGRAAEAVDTLAATFVRCRTDGWFFIPVVERSLHLVEEVVAAYPSAATPLLAAVSEPFAGYILEFTRRRVRIPLATGAPRSELCVAAFEPFEPYPPWEERFLRARLRCYEAVDHPLAGRARRELVSYLDHLPPRFELAAGT